MNRKVLLASLLLATAVPTVVYAQEETNLLSTRKSLLSRTYLRPSISEIYITDGSTHAQQIAKVMRQQSIERFDINKLETNAFQHTLQEGENMQEVITDLLNQKKVGNQIMKSWFPEFVNTQEGYSFRVLEERGRYAATDNDVLANNASARKTLLNELGEQLIDRSYVKVYHIYTKDKDNVKADAYLYKLDFNDEVRTSFYENHFNTPNGIEDASFPLVYVVNASADVSPSKDKDSGNYSYSSGVGGHEKIDIRLSKKVADFKIQTAVFATSPIRAKIGKKEGVKIDDRYDVMELVSDKDGQEVSRRRAVVRVGKDVADNIGEATGETEDFTNFYKFVGGSVQEGMTLVHHPEFGLSISPYFQTNGIGVMVEYRTHLSPGLSVYANAELPYGKRYIIEGSVHKTENGFTAIEQGEDSVHFVNASIGLIKEFNFARNLSWAVGAGVGLLFHTGDDDSIEYTYKGKTEKVDNAVYGEVLSRFGIMFGPNFQLFAQASYSHHFGDFASLLRNFDMIRPFGLGIGAKISF